MNKPSGPRILREDEKSFYLKSQYKGTCVTCREYGQKEKTPGINKLQTYQSVIIATNLGVSRNTDGRESRKKNQRTTRTKITRINAIIAD